MPQSPKPPTKELYDWSGQKYDKGMSELNVKLDRAREATDRGRRQKPSK